MQSRTLRHRRAHGSPRAHVVGRGNGGGPCTARSTRPWFVAAVSAHGLA